MESSVLEILEALVPVGERAGLEGTPERVASALAELTDGYATDVAAVTAGAVFEQAYDEMVLVRDICFESFCEHHLLPFFGKVHIAYIPNGKVIGLSKIPRLVMAFAHRLQLQERMTNQIAEALRDAVAAKGVGVVVEARHLCMEMRGVHKPGAELVTSCMLGTFRKDARTRSEFLGLVRA